MHSFSGTTLGDGTTKIIVPITPRNLHELEEQALAVGHQSLEDRRGRALAFETNGLEGSAPPSTPTSSSGALTSSTTATSAHFSTPPPFCALVLPCPSSPLSAASPRGENAIYRRLSTRKLSQRSRPVAPYQ